MKTMFTLNRTPYNWVRLILLFLLIFSTATNVDAQYQVRKYATRQFSDNGGVDLLGSFSNLPNAVNGDPATSSSLSIGVGVGAWREQILDFNPSSGSIGSYATLINGSVPITIKLTIPSGLLSALSGLEIQAVKNLRHDVGFFNTLDYDNVGSVYTDANLLGLISGPGEREITITPGASYQGIRIRIKGLVNLGYGINIFHAFIKVNATGSINPDERIDVQSGVAVEDLSVANGLGGVVNPWLAVDNNITSTYTVLNTGVQALSEVYHTTVFQAPSNAGDSVRVIIQEPGAGLLDLDLLTNLTIQPYLGNSPAGGALTKNSALLKLKLLSGGDNRYQLIAPVSQSFDRVQVKMGGVAEALTSLRVYDVARIAAIQILPVSIVAFAAKEQNGTTQLSWKTENETSIQSYAVQKSTDGISYTTIGFVFPFDGSLSNNYKFIDNNTVTGISYYRLYIKETDGSARYSNYVTMNYGKSSARFMAITPNPVKAGICIRLSGMETGSYRIALYNQSGQLQQFKTIQVNSNNQVEYMERSHSTTSGVYYLCVYNTNNTLMQSVKILAE